MFIVAVHAPRRNHPTIGSTAFVCNRGGLITILWVFGVYLLVFYSDSYRCGIDFEQNPTRRRKNVDALLRASLRACLANKRDGLIRGGRPPVSEHSCSRRKQPTTSVRYIAIRRQHPGDPQEPEVKVPTFAVVLVATSIPASSAAIVLTLHPPALTPARQSFPAYTPLLAHPIDNGPKLRGCPTHGCAMRVTAVPPHRCVRQPPLAGRRGNGC